MPGDRCARCGAIPAPRRDSDGSPCCERCAITNAATLETPAERRAPLRAGERCGTYEIIEELGRGGMAVVYRARQLGLEREVALKVLRADFVAPDQVERFRREALAVARLSHPHIVPVHDVGEFEGVHWLAMELVRGESLDRRIREDVLDPRLAAACVREVARALHYAHAQGVVHRDVKPANILLAADGSPRVADFGLARLAGATGLTAEGTALGTPAYMAPEQAAGEGARIGPATDVYACGAVLYECLAGSPPFTGGSVLEILRHVQSRAPDSLSTLRPEVPRDLATIAHKALEKAPADRYASAAALADDLDAFLAHRPISGRPIGALGRLQRVVRRRPVLAAVLGLLGAMALGSTVAAWSLANRSIPAGSAAARRRAIPHYEAGAAKLEELKQARLAGDAAGAERALLAAHAALDRAVQADAAFELAYVARARCRQHDGDVAAALTDYDRALELNPQLADALYERARLRFHRHLGRQVGLGVQDAVEMGAIRADLTRLAQLGTRGEREHAVAAMLHLLAGEFEPAIQEAARAVEVNEYFTDAWGLRGAARTARGYVLRGMRQPREAGEVLEAALDDYAQAERRGATAVDVLLGRAQALAGLFRVDEARADTERLLALAPRDSGILLLRARVAMMGGDRARALADLAAVVEQDGATAGVRLARATVLLIPAMAFFTGAAAAGLDAGTIDPADLRQARADLDWVVAGAPTHVIARFFRALASATGGDLWTAARDLHLFLQLSSGQSTFAQAARLWLGALGDAASRAVPREPAALWSALDAVVEAEARLTARRDAAAAERLQEALDELSGLAPAPLRADPWLADVERHVRQRAYVALARVHARAAESARGDARDAEARRALDQLGLAYLHGLRDGSQLERDTDLAVLAARAGFRELLDRLRAAE